MRSLHLLLLVSLIFSTTLAQSQDELRPITIGQAYSDSLTSTGAHRYTVALGANQFVYGEADQVTVDVVIKVSAPDGHEVGIYDITGRGADSFQFTAQDSGSYYIEVLPFEQATGRYEIKVIVAEPVAATPKGRVEQLMTAYDAEDAPGAVVGVYEAGSLSFSKTYGMADLTHGVPISADTRFNLGSVSKQFTGLAFVMLAAEGMLSLDDPVTQYIPDIPTFSDTVTLRHLLTHTSGYREAYGTLGLRGRNTGTDLLRREDAIDVVRRQPELEFAPGSQYQYNSTAFVILTEIAEQVTGQPFPTWIEEHVFAPLGMNQTTIEAEVEAVIPGAASSYANAEGGGYRTAFSNRAYYGAADIYTTVGDMALWLRNFHTAEVGGRAAIDTLTTPYVFNSGDTSRYCLGIFAETDRGLKIFHHSGGHAGFAARLMYYPTLDAGVVVMSNYPAFNLGVSDDIAEAFFGDQMQDEEAEDETEEATKPERWSPSAEALAEFVGEYYSEEVETSYTITSLDSGLVISHYHWGEMALVPITKDALSTRGAFSFRLSFVRDDQDHLTGYRASTGRTNGVLFTKRK